MRVVVTPVVTQKARTVAATAGEFLDAVGPARRHFLPQSLDDPHRAQQAAGIGLTGLEHQKSMQRFGTWIFGLGTEGGEIAPRGDKILFEHFVVAMLIMGVPQN